MVINMKKSLIVVLSSFLIFLSGCTKTSSNEKFTFETLDAGFDTFISFTGYAESKTTFDKYAKVLEEEFKHYDQLFDKYNSYPNINNIKTINDEAGKNSVVIDTELIILLKQAQDFAKLSDNHFDITMGSLLNVWHLAREEGLILNADNKSGNLPSDSDLQSAYEHHGWEHVIIDEEASSVYIDDLLVQLDVGGNAKGYAVQQVSDKMKEIGLKSGIINAGGNVSLIGKKDDGNKWKVGIQVPDAQLANGDSLLTFAIDENQSFVTSGDYQRYYTVDDKMMHHIIDPTTMYPAKYVRSITIVTEDSSIADILSTALFTLSYDAGLALLKKVEKEFSTTIGAIWVYDDTILPPANTTPIKKNNYQIVTTDNLVDSII